jgi:glycosyltransferase involved in cell wall biosynthesis
MNRTVRVTVLMPVYNGERFVREAVDSILAQTFADFELLIFDDGSTDATPQILGEYSDPRIRVVRSDRNLGHTHLLNRGLTEARGMYSARMDADDVAFPDRFEKQVRYLDEHPQVAVVGGTAEVCGPHGPLGVFLRTPCEPEAVRAGLTEGCMVTHPTAMMRTSVIRDLGGYRPIFRSAQDDDLWLRVVERYDIANLPDVVLRYRVHNSQVTSRRIRQTAVASLAARVSAEARRQGKADPLRGLEELTEDFLSEYGVTCRDIDARVRQAIVNRLFLLCSAGRFDLAEDFARQYGAAHADPLLAQRMRVEIELARSKQFLGRRCYARAVWTLMRTTFRHPSSLLRLTQSAYRRLNNVTN